MFYRSSARSPLLTGSAAGGGGEVDNTGRRIGIVRPTRAVSAAQMERDRRFWGEMFAVRDPIHPGDLMSTVQRISRVVSGGDGGGDDDDSSSDGDNDGDGVGDAVGGGVAGGGRGAKDRLSPQSQGQSKKVSSSPSWLQASDRPVQGTTLDPQKHPVDYIAVVMFTLVFKEVALILDMYATETAKMAIEKFKVQTNCCTRKERTRSISTSNVPALLVENFDNSHSSLPISLVSLALEIVNTVVNSPYRSVLVAPLFRQLIVNCCLQVRMVVDDAFTRYVIGLLDCF